MRIHGLSSPQFSGCQDICTVRKTRSGCGIMIVKRPSAVVTPARPPGYKERAAILGIGLLSNSLIANGIDYVLYPWVIWTLGPLHGAAMMTVLSFLICWATLLFYDWAKKDWPPPPMRNAQRGLRQNGKGAPDHLHDHRQPRATRT